MESSLPLVTNPEEPKGSLILAGRDDNAIPTVTTHPDAYYRHNISDEDIDVFVNSSRDGLTDAMWGAVGAFLSSLPSIP